jgi:hypothetical protein
MNEAVTAAQPSPEMKQLRGQRVYCEMRIPLAQAEIKALSAEKLALGARLKAPQAPSEDELKKMRNELIYLSLRLPILTAELKDLTASRKSVLQKLKSVRKAPA